MRRVRGPIRWSAFFAACARAQNSALAAAADLIFYLHDDAELIVARANRTRFEPLRRYTVATSSTWAQPVLSGRRPFIRDVTAVALWVQ